MMTSAPTSTATSARTGAGKLPWSSWLLLLASGVLIFRPLTPTWNDNSNYAFGWLIPLVAAFLFYERWPARPVREVVRPFPVVTVVIFCGIILTAFRLAAEADPDWRPGLWSMVGFYIAAWLGWLWIYGGRGWLRHFAFPVCFLFLTLPWFFQIEYPLTQGLMRWNAAEVATTLRGIGIEAEPAGNVIHLVNGDLGVEEACSGILSLQASFMMGFLLGEIYRLTPWRRVGLVVTALMLALVGNFLRTLFLALTAFYAGMEAVPRWHDWAGYAILVFTGVGTWLLSLVLTSRSQTPVAAVPADEPVGVELWRRQEQAAFRLAVALLVCTVLAEGVTQAWYGWKEKSLVRNPGWTVQLPDSASASEIPPLTLEKLRCDGKTAGHWTDANGWRWNMYWFQYDPKPYTRVVLGWHTPDNCLPSVGMVKEEEYPAFRQKTNGIEFLVRPKRFRSGTDTVYLFWVVYPNRGGLLPEEDTRLERPFGEKLRMHFHDLLEGNRGVGVETLEMAVTGPRSYKEAEASYLQQLGALVRPDQDAHKASQ